MEEKNCINYGINKNAANSDNNINLLWTGGWDSTFQLLQLLLLYKSQVTPFYLIDTGRNSLGKEIETMKKIKDKLFIEYPYTIELLNPIRYYNVNNVSPNEEITKAFNSILKKRHIGIQYERIARLCKELGINDMQLSIEKPLVLNKKYWDINLDNLLQRITVNSQTVYKIDSKFKEEAEFKLFKYFYFPIRKISKIEMAYIAEKRSWNKIIHTTWFCHNPVCNKKPCGKCKPCLMVIKEGFSWRIPVERRAISFYYRKIFWPIKSNVKSRLINIGQLTTYNEG